MAKKVKLRIPLHSEKDEPNVFVGVNGNGVLIPRGVEVEVDPAIKAEYERSEKAKEAAIKRKTSLAKRSAKSIEKELKNYADM